MQRCRIDGVEYDLVTYKTAKTLHLIELAAQSRAVFGEKLGVARLSRMERDAKAAKRAREEAEARGDLEAAQAADDAVLDDSLVWIGVAQFLTLRAAGERVTLVDALERTLEPIDDPDDEGPVVEVEPGEVLGADPTPAGPGSPVTPAPAPRARRARKASTTA